VKQDDCEQSLKNGWWSAAIPEIRNLPAAPVSAGTPAMHPEFVGPK
jgi:hypothetical protein